MTACTRRAGTMFTDCFSADAIEATARRPGLVTRAAKMTGTILRALVTFGVWHDAATTLAPWAAKVAPWDEQRAIAPEALDQRLTKRALALLQDLMGQALAKVPTLEKAGDDGLLPSLPKVSLAASTGVALPKSLPALLPGSGGRAPQAGANIPAVGDSKRSGVDHVALPPWNLPAQT